MPNEYDPKELLSRILQTCGQPDECRKCYAQVLSMTDKDGTTILIGLDGVAHWVCCGAASRLDRLMNILGKPGHCKSCKRPVLWITSKNGKETIWDKNGVSHWATCPDAEDHRKPNTKEPK